MPGLMELHHPWTATDFRHLLPPRDHHHSNSHHLARNDCNWLRLSYRATGLVTAFEIREANRGEGKPTSIAKSMARALSAPSK